MSSNVYINTNSVQCGNQNDLLQNSLDEWTGASMLGPVSHEYKLVRAAANKDDAAGFPWIITVQKKMQQVKGIPEAHAAKVHAWCMVHGMMSHLCPPLPICVYALHGYG